MLGQEHRERVVVRVSRQSCLLLAHPIVIILLVPSLATLEVEELLRALRKVNAQDRGEGEALDEALADVVVDLDVLAVGVELEFSDRVAAHLWRVFFILQGLESPFHPILNEYIVSLHKRFDLGE